MLMIDRYMPPNARMWVKYVAAYAWHTFVTSLDVLQASLHDPHIAEYISNSTEDCTVHLYYYIQRVLFMQICCSCQLYAHSSDCYMKCVQPFSTWQGNYRWHVLEYVPVKVAVLVIHTWLRSVFVYDTRQSTRTSSVRLSNKASNVSARVLVLIPEAKLKRMRIAFYANKQLQQSELLGNFRHQK
jgi:hypothetical protein